MSDPTYEYQAFAGPKRIWRLGHGDGCHSFRLGCYSLLHWEFSDGCRGSSARTPWGAVWGWWRWRKVPLRPEGDK